MARKISSARPRFGESSEHGLENFGIAGASAKISCERGAHFSFRRVRTAIEQIDRRKNHSGSADAALRTAVRDERLLYGMKLLAICDAFDGANHGSVSLQDGDEATVHELTIDLDAARTTFAFAAAFLNSREI